MRSIIEYFERIEVNSIDVTMDFKAKEDSSDKVEVVEDGRIEKAVNAFNLLMRGGGTPKKTPGKKKKGKEKEKPATERKVVKERGKL